MSKTIHHSWLSAGTLLRRTSCRLPGLGLPLLLAVLVISGCVERFEPQIDETQVNLVIDGLLTDREGYHSVRLTRSSAYNDPEITPETNALVEISNSTGSSIVLPESEAGLYEQFFPQSFLVSGEAYTLHVRTSTGVDYYSIPDTLLACPTIDTIYYEQEGRETSNPMFPLDGVQVYLDLALQDHSARNYRWELDETWEYHSRYPIRYYFAGRIFDLGTESRDYMYCWKENRIRDIFTITSSGIEGNNIKGIPLNYISNESNRLKIRYSLLVRQYSMTRDSYTYWNQLQKQSQEGGGLYEQQPVRIVGNVYNPTDPEERVLGNFNVSAVKEKRIFIEENFNFAIWDYNCRLIPVDERNPLGFYTQADWPVYLISRGGNFGPFDMGPDVCFDCREGGGTIVRPDYW